MNNKKNLYMIAGGYWDNFDKILETIFKRESLGGHRVAYVGAANADRRDFFLSSKESLLHAGASDVHPVDLHKHGWEDVCTGAKAIFVAGGDVHLGMWTLLQAKAIPFLQRSYRTGKIFIGISAGSIMLGKKWIAWPDPRNDRKTQLFSCLNLTDIVCDTHDEPGWPELHAVLTHRPRPKQTLGLRSGSAVSILGDKITVIAGTIDVFTSKKGKIIKHNI